MAESKAARRVLQALITGEALPSLPPGLSPIAVSAAARAEGVAGLLLRVAEAQPSSWAGPLVAELAVARRRDLVRTLEQVALAARVLDLLEGRGIRALPLKGVVVAETVCDVESDRAMSDVDVLALERWAEAVRVLQEASFVEQTRGDHAWVCADPASGRLVELHRSVTSCPGLFPVDADAVWARSRPGTGQLSRVPSPEDLLVQLALHASFQHGLALSLGQWLDFRRVLEREDVDVRRLLGIAAASRGEAALAAALLVAEAVVAAPLPTGLKATLETRLPRGLRRWLAPRLGAPLAFVSPNRPAHARVRWELLPGRRAELLWRTLVVPSGPEAAPPLPRRAARTVVRALRLVREQLAGWAPEPVPAKGPDVSEVAFREELLRECLASFPWVRLTVRGQCMQPTLRDGERVHLVHPLRRRPCLGDVVLAAGRGGLRLHRLVWGPPLVPRGRPWRLKADRARLLDPPVERSDVLGVAVAVEGRPDVRLSRPGQAVLSLARGVLARAWPGSRAAGGAAAS